MTQPRSTKLQKKKKRPHFFSSHSGPDEPGAPGLLTLALSLVTEVASAQS